MSCSIIGCETKKDEGEPNIVLYRFPRLSDGAVELREQWTQAMTRQGNVCSRHFPTTVPKPTDFPTIDLPPDTDNRKKYPEFLVLKKKVPDAEMEKIAQKMLYNPEEFMDASKLKVVKSGITYTKLWLLNKWRKHLSSYLIYRDAATRAIRDAPEWMRRADDELQLVHYILQKDHLQEYSDVLRSVARVHEAALYGAVAAHVDANKIRSAWHLFSCSVRMKLQWLSCRGDMWQQLPRVARLSPLEWEYSGQVIMDDDHVEWALIYSVSALGRPIPVLLHLAKLYKLEDKTASRELRERRWAAACRVYRKSGLHCPPLLLQRRWQQLKQDARRAIAAPHQHRPHLYHWLLVCRWPHVVTEPLPTWQQLKARGLVYDLKEHDLEKLEPVEPEDTEDSVDYRALFETVNIELPNLQADGQKDINDKNLEVSVLVAKSSKSEMQDHLNELNGKLLNLYTEKTLEYLNNIEKADRNEEQPITHSKQDETYLAKQSKTNSESEQSKTNVDNQSETNLDAKKSETFSNHKILTKTQNETPKQDETLEVSLLGNPDNEVTKVIDDINELESLDPKKAETTIILECFEQMEFSDDENEDLIPMDVAEFQSETHSKEDLEMVETYPLQVFKKPSLENFNIKVEIKVEDVDESKPYASTQTDEFNLFEDLDFIKREKDSDIGVNRVKNSTRILFEDSSDSCSLDPEPTCPADDAKVVEKLLVNTEVVIKREDSEQYISSINNETITMEQPNLINVPNGESECILSNPIQSCTSKVISETKSEMVSELLKQAESIIIEPDASSNISEPIQTNVSTMQFGSDDEQSDLVSVYYIYESDSESTQPINSEFKTKDKIETSTLVSESEPIESEYEQILAKLIQSGSENSRIQSENIQSESENIQNKSDNIQSESENVQSESENVQSESENIQSESENASSESNKSRTLSAKEHVLPFYAPLPDVQLKLQKERDKRWSWGDVVRQGRLLTVAQEGPIRPATGDDADKKRGVCSLTKLQNLIQCELVAHISDDKCCKARTLMEAIDLELELNLHQTDKVPTVKQMHLEEHRNKICNCCCRWLIRDSPPWFSSLLYSHRTLRAALASVAKLLKCSNVGNVGKYIISGKGRILLRHGGYKYEIQNFKRKKKRWLCFASQRSGCEASIYTLAGVIVATNGEHNHPPADETQFEEIKNDDKDKHTLFDSITLISSDDDNEEEVFYKRRKTKQTVKPLNRPVSKLVQKPSNRPVSKLVQKPSNRPVSKLVQKPSNRPVSKLVQKPANRPVSKLVQKPSNRPVSKLVQNSKMFQVLTTQTNKTKITVQNITPDAKEFPRPPSIGQSNVVRWSKIKTYKRNPTPLKQVQNNLKNNLTKADELILPTTEPATVTTETATVTTEPATVTTEPATVTTEPATVTTESVTVTSEPVTVTQNTSAVLTNTLSRSAIQNVDSNIIKKNLKCNLAKAKELILPIIKEVYSVATKTCTQENKKSDLEYELITNNEDVCVHIPTSGAKQSKPLVELPNVMINKHAAEPNLNKISITEKKFKVPNQNQTVIEIERDEKDTSASLHENISTYKIVTYHDGELIVKMRAPFVSNILEKRKYGTNHISESKPMNAKRVPDVVDNSEVLELYTNASGINPPDVVMKTTEPGVEDLKDENDDTIQTPEKRSRSARDKVRNSRDFSAQQIKTLKAAFEKNRYLSVSMADRRRLGRQLGLTESQVKEWFKNHRMKWKPYERGHSRAALSVHTFPTDESPRDSAPRPPLPTRCSSLERPSVPAKSNNANTAQHEFKTTKPSSLPPHLTKGASNGRLGNPRNAFSAQQIKTLKAEFKKNRHLSESAQGRLATQLGLTEMQIKVWFEKRRLKWQRKCRNDVDELVAQQKCNGEGIGVVTPRHDPPVGPLMYINHRWTNCIELGK